MAISSVFRLILLAGLWGGSFLFMKISVPIFGPAYVAELRVLLAAIFLFLFSRVIRHKQQVRPYWKHFVVIGFLNSALPFMLFAYAALTLPTSIMAIINSMAPIFAAVLGALFFKQRTDVLSLLGLVVGVAGVSLVTMDNGSLTQGSMIAIFAAVGAALSYGCASIYAKFSMPVIHPIDNAQSTMWVASLMILPLALNSEVTVAPDLSAWWAIGVLGVLCTGFAYLLYFRLIQDEGPVKALTVTFLIPVFGTFWGWLFLDEIVSLQMIFGGALVLVGTAMANGISFGSLPRLREIS